MTFFGKVFNGIGHFFAWVVGSAVPVVTTVATDAANVIESPLGMAIAGLLGPQGAAVQSGANAFVGAVLGVMSQTGKTAADVVAALNAGGINISADTVAVQGLETLYAALVTGVKAAGKAL